MKFDERFNLFSVTIDINDFCNMKCSYCWEQQNKSRLSMETADIICDKLIGNFKKHKLASDMRLHFFGGEPLIDWNVLIYMVNKIKQSIPLWVGITTNGILITPEIVSDIKKNDIRVMISIDGKKERHDQNRKTLGGDGTHDRVVAAIRMLQENGVDFEARMTILPEHAKFVEEDVRYLIEDLGIRQVAPCPVYDRDWTEEQMQEFGNGMERLYDLYVSRHFDWQSKVYIKFFEDYLFKDLDTKHFCVPCAFGSNTTVTIDTEGNVYPCHQVPTRKDKQKFVIANILKDEVYENDMIKIMLPYIFKSSLCSECPANGTICNGGCPMESYEANGNLITPTCSSCKFNILYYNVAKRIQEKRGIPSPVSPSERRDFLHSVIMRMVENIRSIVKDKKDNEYSDEEIGTLSEAMWLINEQLLNNKPIHLNTPDLMKEIEDVKNLIRAEVVNKNG